MKLFRFSAVAIFLTSILAAIQGCNAKDLLKALLILFALSIGGGKEEETVSQAASIVISTGVLDTFVIDQTNTHSCGADIVTTQVVFTGGQYGDRRQDAMVKSSVATNTVADITSSSNTNAAGIFTISVTAVGADDCKQGSGYEYFFADGTLGDFSAISGVAFDLTDSFINNSAAQPPLCALILKDSSGKLTSATVTDLLTTGTKTTAFSAPPAGFDKTSISNVAFVCTGIEAGDTGKISEVRLI